MKINKDKYLKFPLCLLASSKEFERVLLNILSYSITVFSKNKINMDITNAKEMAEGITNSEYAPLDFDKHNEEELFIVGALHYFQIKISSLNALQNTYSRLEHYVNNYEKEYGNDSFAKVHRDIFVETVSNEFEGKNSEKFFRTLCSITAILGTNPKYPFKRITKERIICGYYGYKSKKVFDIEFNGSFTITKRQISYVVSKLAERDLFRYATRKKRLSYYSTLLNYEEFIEAIAQYEFKLLEKRSKKIIANNYISKRINDEISKHPFLK